MTINKNMLDAGYKAAANIANAAGESWIFNMMSIDNVKAYIAQIYSTMRALETTSDDGNKS